VICFFLCDLFPFDILFVFKNYFNFDKKKLTREREIEDNLNIYIYLFKINSESIEMSLDTQKLDVGQRQQIMTSVQQQLALQNAQELLQVNRLNSYFQKRECLFSEIIR